jgi:hypothetical protein
MRKDKWFLSPEVFFSCLSIFMATFLTVDIVLIVFDFPILYVFYIAHFTLILISAVSLLSFLLISWHLKRRRARRGSFGTYAQDCRVGAQASRPHARRQDRRAGRPAVGFFSHR